LGLAIVAVFSAGREQEQAPLASLREAKSDSAAPHAGHAHSAPAEDREAGAGPHSRMADKEYSTCLPPAGASAIGVLVLAHGGTPRRDRLVMNAVEPLAAKARVCVAFGMGFSDSSYLLDAVREL